VHKPLSLTPNRSSKMQEGQQMFFGLPLVSEKFQHPAIQTEIVQFFSIFIHQKSAPTKRKKGSEQAGGWIHFCMERLRT
jgi:hypothetical protein